TFTATTAYLQVSAPDGGTITSDPPGIICGQTATDCRHEYPINTPVTLSATAAAGRSFDGWGDICFGLEPECAVTLNADQQVSATFTPLTLEVALVNNGAVTSEVAPGTVEIELEDNVTAADGTVTNDNGNLECSGVCSIDLSEPTATTLTAVANADWQFIGWGGDCTGNEPCVLNMNEPSNVIANFVQTNNAYRIESPMNGSRESGISLVSGFVCRADGVELQVDDFPIITADYGVNNPNSEVACSDNNNGFTAAINWAKYGNGDHVLKLLVESLVNNTITVTEAARTTVTVTSLGNDFLTRLHGTTTVPDFPDAASYTTLIWSEPHQNFVVTSNAPVTITPTPQAARQASRAGEINTPQNWESPLPDGFESGRTLMRGWACDAQIISASIDNTIFNLPYGSTRDDTLGVCGDVNNGYTFAVNWNQFGEGSHNISLVLDGVTFTRTFTIATPAGRGVVSGIQHQHRMTSFPYPGDLLTLRWSEPHQNFRIDEYRARATERLAIDWQIAEIYLATLGYAPDSEGLQYWVNEVVNHGWTVAMVAESFFDNPLVQARYPVDQGNETLVDALYQNIFNRAADDAGKTYWLGELSAGHIPRHALILAMINGGWANPLAATDMGRFRYLTEVALTFAANQAQRGWVYTQLTPLQQEQLRTAGTNVLIGVTADYDTRNAAINRIPQLLDAIVPSN
ncbi:DUF4214 domain-containing protein, partial [Thiospirillum jenense]